MESLWRIHSPLLASRTAHGLSPTLRPANPGAPPAGQNRSIETQLHRAQKGSPRPQRARLKTLGAVTKSAPACIRCHFGMQWGVHCWYCIELVDSHALRSWDARKSTDSDERSRSLDATSTGRYIHCAWPRHGTTSGPLAIRQGRRVGGGRWDLCGEMGFWPWVLLCLGFPVSVASHRSWDTAGLRLHRPPVRSTSTTPLAVASPLPLIGMTRRHQRHTAYQGPPISPVSHRRSRVLSPSRARTSRSSASALEDREDLRSAQVP